MKKIQRITLKHTIIVLLSCAMVAIFAGIALNISLFSPITNALNDFSMTDQYYQILEEKENQLITIVDLSDLFGRGEIANALEEIEKCNPSVIGLDCTFEGIRDDSIGNEALIRIARKYPNIVYAQKLSDEHTDSLGYERCTSSFFVKDIPVIQGIVNYPRTLYSDIKRTARLNWNFRGEQKASFLKQIIRLYDNDESETNEGNELSINFQRTDFCIISPDKILQNRERLEGRIVLFGAMSGDGGTDMHYTPIGKMSGIELHAYSIQTVLEQKEITYLPKWAQVTGLFVLLFLTSVMQSMHISWTSSQKSPFIRHILGSSFVIDLVTLGCFLIIVFFSFFVFCKYHLSIDISWSIAAIAFLSTSRSLFAACEEYFHSFSAP